jgi:uncharacterized damage-inducible protein DinB
MKFQLEKAMRVLEQTPTVLNALFTGIPDEWVHTNEGENTWSAFDAVGHLIVCEKTDFITRAEIILSDSETKILFPIDMHAQFEWNKGKTMPDLLNEFEQNRKENIQKLLAFNLRDNDFQKTGIHPKIGKLTLRELLATWVVHDFNHISQITRVIAKQYKTEVGPFIEFLSILK